MPPPKTRVGNATSNWAGTISAVILVTLVLCDAGLSIFSFVSRPPPKHDLLAPLLLLPSNASYSIEVHVLSDEMNMSLSITGQRQQLQLQRGPRRADDGDDDGGKVTSFFDMFGAYVTRATSSPTLGYTFEDTEGSEHFEGGKGDGNSPPNNDDDGDDDSRRSCDATPVPPGAIHPSGCATPPP